MFISDGKFIEQRKGFLELCSIALKFGCFWEVDPDLKVNMEVFDDGEADSDWRGLTMMDTGGGKVMNSLLPADHFEGPSRVSLNVHPFHDFYTKVIVCGIDGPAVHCKWHNDGALDTPPMSSGLSPIKARGLTLAKERVFWLYPVIIHWKDCPTVIYVMLFPRKEKVGFLCLAFAVIKEKMSLWQLLEMQSTRSACLFPEISVRGGKIMKTHVIYSPSFLGNAFKFVSSNVDVEVHVHGHGSVVKAGFMKRPAVHALRTVFGTLDTHCVSSDITVLFPFKAGDVDNVLERILCPFPLIVQIYFPDFNQRDEGPPDNNAASFSTFEKGDLLSCYSADFKEKGDHSRAPR